MAALGNDSQTKYYFSVNPANHALSKSSLFLSFQSFLGRDSQYEINSAFQPIYLLKSRIKRLLAGVDISQSWLIPLIML